MSAKKSPALLKYLFRRAADHGFRAARIGDERVRRNRLRNRGKNLNRHADREGKIHEVSIVEGFERVARYIVDRAERTRTRQHRGPVPASDTDVWKFTSQREAKRAS